MTMTTFSRCEVVMVIVTSHSPLLFNTNTRIHCNNVLRVAEQRVKVHFGNLGSGLHESTHSGDLFGVNIHIHRLLATHALQNLVAAQLSQQVFGLDHIDRCQRASFKTSMKMPPSPKNT